MLLSAASLTALLNSLGLTSSIFKPIPDLVGSLAAPVDGVVSTADGLISGLGLPLPALTALPILGSLLVADVSQSNATSTGSSCFVNPYDPPPVLSQEFPPFDQAKANVFRYRQQQSVNLGSWFVHEQWMTPSLFTCASGPQMAEIDIASGWGNTTAARALLEHHWDTFINQSDFEYLASIGINTVRLPIGYWSLGPYYCAGTAFDPVADVYTNAWSRVVRAVNWAGEAGLGVLIDLHGAPGSQNGQPHSGISDGQTNLFGNDTNIQKTMDVLSYLVEQFASVTNVIGVELLNEPNDDPTLSDFYTQAINSLRQISAEAAVFPIYVQDAYDMDRFNSFVSQRTDFVVEDHHSYFVFAPSDVSQNVTQDMQEVQGTVSDQLSTASALTRGNIIIGEWSCALVPTSLSNSSDPLLARQQFCEGQQQVYTNLTAGWSFWSYTKEDCDTDLDWCFKNAVGNTLPSTFFSYGSAPVTSPSQSMDIALAVAQMVLPSMTEVMQSAGDQALSSASSTTVDSPSPSPANSKRSAHHNRFAAIHARRSFYSDLTKHRRDASPAGPSLNATELAITKGYSDGYLTAKIFAQYGMSKLGLKSQYMSDSMSALGTDVVAPGTEDYYTAWFGRGLSDGEAAISTAVAQ